MLSDNFLSQVHNCSVYFLIQRKHIRNKITYQRCIKNIILCYLFFFEDFGITFFTYFQFSNFFLIIAQYQLKNISNMHKSYHFGKSTFESTRMMIHIKLLNAISKKSKNCILQD